MKNLISVLFLIIGFTTYCQENNPLNKITIKEISLPKDDGSQFIIKLTENKYNYEYNYRDLKIGVLYYKKGNYIYDNPPYDNSNIKYMQLFEQFNSKKIGEMPSLIWHQNIRFNNINNYKYADSFIFIAHDYTTKLLIRLLYLTTENYYIRIRITPGFTPNDIEYEKIFQEIYQETPQYFRLDPVIKINGKEIIVWSQADAIKFGNDLLAGIHGSKIVNLWFKGTEEILKMIQYK
jgi:hypothetical protein